MRESPAPLLSGVGRGQSPPMSSTAGKPAHGVSRFACTETLGQSTELKGTWAGNETNDAVDSSVQFAASRWRVAMSTETEKDAPSPALGKTTKDLTTLLEELQLVGLKEDIARLPDDSAKAWADHTPESLQVIKSGATAFTKSWTNYANRAGGTAAALSLVAGGITGFFQKLAVPVPITVTLIAGGSALGAAIAVSIAVVISADLSARGIASAARSSARAGVSAAFLAKQVIAGTETSNQLTQDELALMIAVATGRSVSVRKKRQRRPRHCTKWNDTYIQRPHTICRSDRRGRHR